MQSSKLILLLFIVAALSSCCSWSFDSGDFNFTAEDVDHFDAYDIGDTVYFVNRSGNIAAITITETEEESEKGSRCFISEPPYHSRTVRIQHLPEDKWYGTTYFEGETKEIRYQPILSITKYPSNKFTRYNISFREFLFTDTTFGKPTTVRLADGITINNCYAFKHSYPERIKEATDIGLLYWTDQYGLTAYTCKNGDTWLIGDLK